MDLEPWSSTSSATLIPPPLSVMRPVAVAIQRQRSLTPCLLPQTGHSFRKNSGQNFWNRDVRARWRTFQVIPTPSKPQPRSRGDRSDGGWHRPWAAGVDLNGLPRGRPALALSLVQYRAHSPLTLRGIRGYRHGEAWADRRTEARHQPEAFADW